MTNETAFAYHYVIACKMLLEAIVTESLLDLEAAMFRFEQAQIAAYTDNERRLVAAMLDISEGMHGRRFTARAPFLADGPS